MFATDDPCAEMARVASLPAWCMGGYSRRGAWYVLAMSIDLQAPSLPRALVADDDPDSAECLALLLERDGFEVRVAHDGRTALAIAAAFHPDVALVDVVMPECSGLDVAARIRSATWGSGIKLIATSGRCAEADKRAALAVGFDAHLTKPLDYDKLRSFVRESALGRASV